MFFDELARLAPSAVAIGDFDGVHIGHAAIIAHLCDYAEGHGLTPVALTFDVNTKHSKALTGSDKKRDLLISCGAGAVVTAPFAELKDIPAEEFASRLAECGVKAAVCGEDFRFGKGALGDVKVLANAGIEAVVLPPIKALGDKVSSTRIRHAVAEGDDTLVSLLLGR